MQKSKFIRGLAIATAILAPSLVTSPARAATNCNGTSASSNSFTVAELGSNPSSFTCTLLDGTVLAWNPGSVPTVAGQFGFQNTSATQYSLTFTPSTGPSGPASSSYSYTFTSKSGFRLNAAQTNTTLGLGATATTNTLSGPVFSAPNASGVVSTGGNVSAVGSLNPKLVSATFTSAYNVATGEDLITVTDTFGVQAIPAGTGVPAPLPLLGAGVAFGFSRKVRQRIKSVA